MTGAYHELRVHVSHRAAAGLAGVSRATAHRRAVLGPARPPVPRRAPVNRLSAGERARILAVLNSDRFVDTTPIEVFATLGRYRGESRVHAGSDLRRHHSIPAECVLQHDGSRDWCASNRSATRLGMPGRAR
jgi:hypothetical protein